jgi:hypothetical protein
MPTRWDRASMTPTAAPGMPRSNSKPLKPKSMFHKTTEYADIGRFDDSVTYDDDLADLSADFHDLRGDDRFEACLAPDTYAASETLALHLLDQGSLGVVYPSVRYAGGTCLACVRPTVVGNVRRRGTYRFSWSGSPIPVIEVVAP